MSVQETSSVHGLRKSYGRTEALSGVDLSFPAGRVTVVLGPSGCGKTTLLRILAGLVAPDEGRVVLGSEVVSDPGIRVPVERRGVGMVFQDALLWPHLSVRGNIAFPLGTGHRKDPRVLEAARTVEVEDFLDRHPGELSGGEKRRVAIARAIVGRPKLLLLDEPLSGLDANLRVRLLAVIRRVQRALDLTAVYVTHDQEEALGLAHHVVVMRDGRVQQVGTPEEVYRHPRTPFVARFVGLAVVVEGQVAGGRAETVLGTFSTNGLSAGPHAFAFRPENLCLVEEGGVVGEVVERLFQGDRWLVTVRLGDLEVMAFSHEEHAPGDGVRVALASSPVAVHEEEAQ